jgi:hypothetical protein
MSARQAYLDRTPGEIRGVVTLNGRPEHLILARDDDDPRLQPGARIAARVRKVEPAFASAFVDLGEGIEGLLDYPPDRRPVEGEMLEVEVRAAPRPGKLAAVRARAAALIGFAAVTCLGQHLNVGNAAMPQRASQQLATWLAEIS